MPPLKVIMTEERVNGNDKTQFAFTNAGQNRGNTRRIETESSHISFIMELLEIAANYQIFALSTSFTFTRL